MSITAGMEHGPHDDTTATYSTTVFWYGREGAAEVENELYRNAPGGLPGNPPGRGLGWPDAG